MGKRYYLVVRVSFLNRLEVKREEMNFKQKLIMVVVIVMSITIAITGLYYLMSPYQRCMRTFTQELDLEGETPQKLVFYCMERTNW